MSVCTGFLCWYLGTVAVYNITDFCFSLIFSAVLFILAVLGVLLKRLKAKRLWYALGALVAVLTFSAATEPSPDGMYNYLDRYVELDGVITQVPDQYDEYYSYVLTADRLLYNDAEIELDKKIRITCEHEFSTGNKVKFRGFLKEIKGPENSTEFDFKRYYKSKGISFSVHAEEAELLEERTFLFSPVYGVEYVKNRVATAIDRFYADDDAGIIKAVLLGKRSSFTDEFEKVLVTTSALRFLYPSFLHIFFLISLLEFLFMAFPKRKREMLMVAALFIFAVFNGNYITFVRAALILGGVMLYRRLRGFSHYPDIMAIVVTTALVSNPLLLYNSGFVMSVSIGMLLHWFRRPLAAKLGFIKNANVRTMVAVWIIGTLGLMPLSAYYYNGASFYSVIFSFIYTPLSMLLFVLSPITLLLYELFGSAGIFGVLIDAIVRLMKNIPNMVALLPGYYLALGRTGVVGFSVSFIIVMLFKYAVDGCTKTLKFRLLSASLAVIFCIYTVSVFSDFNKMKITFVNVGQGDAAIVDIIGHDTLLVDGGGGMADSEYNVGEKVFLPYLISKGYSKIDLAIVSHCHRDHAEGIVAAIENLDVHTVMLSNAGEDGEYRELIIDAAQKHNTDVLYVSAGDRLEFGSGLVIDVLSPVSGAVYEDENDCSLALKMEYDGASVFFGGDISSDIENNISGQIGKTDIVKVSHHGSKDASSDLFVKETSPRYAVFSVGRNNVYSHPSAEALEVYHKSGARILRTDRMCDIVLKCDKDKIAAAWHGEVLKWQ